METILMAANDAAITAAVQLLRAAQVVGVPTETVYGLAAKGLCAPAVDGIFAAKGRPADNPLILHVADKDQALELWKDVPPLAEKLMDAFWPGPFTVVLPAGDIVPANVRAGLPTVAVRCPAHPWMRKLIAACGFPLAAPSANTSGKPSPTTAQAVLDDMDGRIALVVDGGASRMGVESTVVAVQDDGVRLLRPGGVTYEQLCKIAGSVVLDDGVLQPLPADARPASPGMKYRHYAPQAQVTLYDGPPQAVQATICRDYDAGQGNTVILARGRPARYAPRRCYDAGADAGEYARRIFGLLRRADDDGYARILAEVPPCEGMGLAVRNRMLRAAGFRVVHANEIGNDKGEKQL
ncbi:MAG: L-threonylcarbamoyladenylate synthase [Eubacteriales bacterium]|nr:L-threonylcarbamoyladenylate synthase [Eubacteriales bacterium]